MVSSSSHVIDRMLQAVNDHDPDALERCFHGDYRSEQPLHPERGFGGHEQVGKNWSLMFDEVPDLQVELLRSAENGDEVWAELLVHGHKTGGAPFEYRGMTVQGIRGDRIAWARLYFEPVERGGAGIDESMRRLVGREEV